MCALALFQTIRLLNGLHIELTHAAVLVFSSTVVYYNFHDISSKLDFSTLLNLKKSIGDLRLPESEWVLLLFCIIASGWSLFYLDFRLIFLFVFISLLSLSYSVPLIPRNGKRIRTREVFVYKLSVIAICWALVSVIVPIWEENLIVQPMILWAQVLMIALFVFALCIPFEIRDVNVEKSRGIKTIPIVVGIRRTKFIGLLALLFSMFLQYFIYTEGAMSGLTLIALLISSVLSIALVLGADDEPSDFYCKFYIDGLMIVQFLLVFVSLNYDEKLF